jgi:hypothetical protein
MIVPNMNSEELLEEIYKDLEVVIRKANYLTQGLRRQAVKSKGKYVQRVYDYKSLRHNRWFIIVDYYVKEPSVTVIAYYTDQYGLNGILVDGTNQGLIHFTPHFLERYNERFLKQDGVTKVELLKRFVPANPLQVIKVVQKIDANQNRIFGRFKEGIGLGYNEDFHVRGKVIHHFKTYISNNMILEFQIEDFNILGKYYDAYWEEGYGGGKKCA